MRAEIIAVGTELLLGNIVNTNARDLSVMLADLGINVYWHSVVGDNPERLRQSLEVAKDRADLIITTGGLGPTCDDLTKQTVSAIIKKFLKQGYVSLTESETDRRNKIVRFTKAGIEYTQKIIPPAAHAEIDAMSELSGEDIAELVRLTTLFSRCMREKFESIQEQS